MIGGKLHHQSRDEGPGWICLRTGDCPTMDGRCSLQYMPRRLRGDPLARHTAIHTRTQTRMDTRVSTFTHVPMDLTSSFSLCPYQSALVDVCAYWCFLGLWKSLFKQPRVVRNWIEVRVESLFVCINISDVPKRGTFGGAQFLLTVPTQPNARHNFRFSLFQVRDLVGLYMTWSSLVRSAPVLSCRIYGLFLDE